METTCTCQPDAPCASCAVALVDHARHQPHEVDRVQALKFWGQVLQRAEPLARERGGAGRAEVYSQQLALIRQDLAALGVVGWPPLQDGRRPAAVPPPPPPPPLMVLPKPLPVPRPGLAQRELPLELEGELRWYFCDSDLELGVRSNFGAMVKALEQGRGGGGYRAPPEPAAGAMWAASRARPVARTLEAAGPLSARILWLALGHHPPGLAAFGRVAGLVPSTAAAHQAWKESRTNRSLPDWLKRLCARAEKGEVPARLVVGRLREEAERLLGAATATYLVARRRVADRERARREGAARARKLREVVAAGVAV